MTRENYIHLLESLIKTSLRPPLFEPVEARFWNDPYISARLLEAHLDPSHDAASRKPEIIDKEVGNLISSGTLKPGDRVLDLGCGPGLYASRIAEKGMRVTGVDISEGSLNYAIAQAKEKALYIEYRIMNFLEMDYDREFDAVLQTNGEINTFSDSVRDDLLARVHRALKPGGRLIFDATTRVLRKNTGFGNRWEISRGGLWRPGPSLVLEQGFDYPEQDVFLNQYTVIDETGTPATYRFWFHDYSLQTLRQALMYDGFKVTQVWNDLSGTPYKEGGEWLAVVADKS